MKKFLAAFILTTVLGAVHPAMGDGIPMPPPPKKGKGVVVRDVRTVKPVRTLADGIPMPPPPPRKG